MSKHYQPNITAGFNMNQLELIRTLGQGMNGAVNFYFYPLKFVFFFFLIL
jgi:hypothetical protein